MSDFKRLQRPRDLTREQLEAVVDCVQQMLYFDEDFSSQTEFWNPDKEWELNEDIQPLVALLEAFGMVPDEVVRS